MNKIIRTPLYVTLLAALQAVAQPVPSIGLPSSATSVQPASAESVPIEKNVIKPAAPIATSMDKVKVSGFRFSGNSVMSEAQLQEVVASDKGATMDLAGLEAVAAKVSKLYRSNGYSLARAYIPAQRSAGGVIEIAVIEARYGDLVLKSSGGLSKELIEGIYNANACTGADLCKGQVITDEASNRALLLLRDIPGMSAKAAFQAGKTVGASDYVLDIKPVSSTVSSVGYDNYGSPSIGTNRLNYSLDKNNLTGGGDQLSLNVATMGLKQLTGGISYSLPVGYWGTRAGVGYAHSLSRLGGSFAALNATVVGDSISLYGLHPILRGVNGSLYVRAAADVGGGKTTVSGVTYKSNTTAVRLGLNGDGLDGYGGYTVYGLGAVSGHYADQYGGTDARYAKASYSISRQQSLGGGGFTLFGSLMGQTTNTPLPAGELLSLGGPGAVRAYAGGEGGNAVGAVGTLELRYTQALSLAGAGGQSSLITYALFADRGWSDTYRGNPLGNYKRLIGGAGLGVTMVTADFYLRASVARHGKDGANASEINPNSASQVWLQAGVKF